MQWNWQEMWQHMGLPALIVAGVLFTMGFACLLVFLERMVLFVRARLQNGRFQQAVAEHFRTGDWQKVIVLANDYPASPLARLVGTALKVHWETEVAPASRALSRLERTQRHMERYIEQVGAELRRGFAVLSSVGSTAPFVGLLGTVLGIITAFQGIAQSGSGGLAAVSAGIAEALVETALGLVVAIPAVLAFHFLTTRANAEEALLKNVLGELLDRLPDESEEEALLARSASDAVLRSELGEESWSSYPARLEAMG